MDALLTKVTNLNREGNLTVKTATLHQMEALFIHE